MVLSSASDRWSTRIVCCLVFALGLLGGPAHAAGLVVDPARPAVVVPDNQLTELLIQRKDSPVILNFWASWCDPCRAEMPSLQRLGQRWRDRGLSVLTIAVADKPGRSTQFLWDTGVLLPLLEDPDQATARALGVKTLPTTLILDRAHRVVARGRGAIDWDAAAIDKQLQELLR
jgi:thiol-disulfide isomerase/thioredoxin